MEQTLLGLLAFSGVIIASLVGVLFKSRNSKVHNPGSHYEDMRVFCREANADLISGMGEVVTEVKLLRTIIEERLPRR